MSVLIASFDIGRENFAFYVEEVYLDDITTIRDRIKVPPKTKWYQKSGEPTPEFQEVLNEVYLSGKVREWKNHDIRDPNNLNPKQLNNQILFNLTTLLRSYRELWDSCDMFLVEQQHRLNPAAIWVSHHLMAHLIEIYGTSKPIFQYSANMKYRVNGCPKMKNGKKITKYQRKKWAVELGNDIMELREDDDGLEQLNRTKADDLGDTLVQLQAYKFQKWVENLKTYAEH